MAALKIAIAGASGRMGHALLESVLRSSDLKLAAALERAGHASLGKDAGELIGSPCGTKIASDVAKAAAAADVLVDFTLPDGAMEHLAACRKQGTKMVIGTTGFSDAQKKEIAAAAKEIGIVMAPNFSVGVNVALRLLEIAAKALDKGYDIEIFEAHHRHKVDAPSGTALRMGEVVAQALGRDLKKVAVYGREGVTGERKDETIAFTTVRGGDIVGDHSVMFIGAGERLEVAHRASSRANFANGALRAARWIAQKKSGLYDMADVLGFAK